jgi:TonB family protein
MSKSVAVVSLRAGELSGAWGDFLPDPYSWANSTLIHLFVIAALLLPFALRPSKPIPPIRGAIRDYVPLVLTFPHLAGKADSNHGGGGGGDRTPLPPSHGALPQFAQTQFTPPRVSVPRVDPLLPMPPTLLGPPELMMPKSEMPFGDPLSHAQFRSQGPGSGDGIGTKHGTGDGPGDGPGYGPGENGGCCDGAFAVGVGGVSAPIPIYSPEPAYSEEARKAKYGGIVMLWIVVDAQGLVRAVKVVKSLGMGLDEEAMKAVSTWRFKAGMRQGVPVPVRAQVEVRFQLF